VHWVRLGGCFGTERADGTGLPPISLSRLRQTVQLNPTRYRSDVIALVVLWRLRYKLSLRDLPEMFLIRGIVFSHEAVRDQEARLTPGAAEDLRRRRRGKAGQSWYVDPTCIKVHGQWRYLYRAIDRSGVLVDVMFSEHRDMAAACNLSKSAQSQCATCLPQRPLSDFERLPLVWAWRRFYRQKIKDDRDRQINPHVINDAQIGFT
jgi:transposase-like protein